GRADADVGRRAPLPLLPLPGHAGRVDAVAGVDERGVGDEVGGREAELAAALLAVGDDALYAERRAEQRGRLLQLAGLDEAADARGGDDLAVGLYERDDARLEAGVGAQQFGVASGAVAEPEVLADRDVRGAEPADEHVVDERLRALLGGRLV